MKRKVIFIRFLCLLFLFAGLPQMTKAEDKEFRVGMEAAYAPFNWTQPNDANGAVKIDGSDQYANGYDVQVSKALAKELGRKLVIVKTGWDGLLPALQSKKIDAIVAGMSPTAERKEQVAFSDNYYTSDLVILINSNGKYKDATSLEDFKGAKITGQLGTFHYTMINQIPDVVQQPAMKDFSSMRVALESNTIDGYVTERPEGVTAESLNKNFKMIQFKEGKGFKADPDDTSIAVGLRKGDDRLAKINAYLKKFTKEKQVALMDEMIKKQPQEAPEATSWFEQVFLIAKQNAQPFLQGTAMTLFVSLIGTVVGTVIGLLIGVYRTMPQSESKALRLLHKVIATLISVYIEVFRGTPMIVQAMVLYYGLALAFQINLDRTLAALLIVSINTGAYMSEIVRGGIFAVDIGQFEAAQAIGMTHAQTMRKVVLPQVLRNILPATGNEFVINIKDTSVLNVISVSELFFQANTVAQQNYMYFQTFAVVCVIYFVLTFTITRILRLIEKKMDGPDTQIVTTNQMQTGKLEQS